MGLFELDAVPFADPGPYKHKYVYTVEGVVREQLVAYTQRDWAVPPEKPTMPYFGSDPELAAMWDSYKLYKAVILHEQKRHELRLEYYRRVADYIIEHCVAPEDRNRIVTRDDYDRIYAAAVIPEVRLEDIDAALASTFQG